MPAAPTTAPAAAPSSSAITSRAGLYAQYPSLDPARWVHGEDMEHTIDFRGIYGTVLEQWMGLDPTEIVGGHFEQINPYSS